MISYSDNRSLFASFRLFKIQPFAPKASFDEEQERRGKRSGTKGLELATLSLDDTGHLTREHDDAGNCQGGENNSIGRGVH
jgi:hypothetical protein